MQTKLTLRLDGQLIEQAKVHARNRGKSVSQMVADYFAVLDREERSENLPPLARSLQGAWRGAALDRDQYRKYLEEKHL